MYARCFNTHDDARTCICVLLQCNNITLACSHESAGFFFSYFDGRRFAMSCSSAAAPEQHGETLSLSFRRLIAHGADMCEPDAALAYLIVTCILSQCYDVFNTPRVVRMSIRSFRSFF